MASINRNTNWNRHWLLYSYWYWFGYVHWVGPVDGHLDRYRNRAIYCIGHMFLYSVGLRNTYGHFNWVGTINGHRIWAVYTYGHLHLNLFLYNYRVGFLNRHWIGFLYWHRHRTVDWYMYRHINMFNDLIRLWNGNGYFDGHFDMTYDFIRLRNAYFHGHLYMFDDFVRLWHGHLHWVGTVNGYMYWNFDTLLYSVGLRYRYCHLDILFVVYRYLTYDFVGLWNGYLDWIRHWFFMDYRVRSIYMYWYGYALSNGYGFVHIGLLAY